LAFALKASLALAAMIFTAIQVQAASSQAAATATIESSGSRFEVASIKPAPPISSERGSVGRPPGVRMDKVQASFGGMSLSALISYAYGIKLAQISGPDWLSTERFDIVTKLPEGGSTERVPEMMQRLLAERFGMKFHRESKAFPVYALVTAKAGVKPNPKPEDFDPKAHPDQLAIPILSLTLMLEQILDLPVVDETGLQGQYLFPSHAIQQAMTAGTMAKAQEHTARASGGVTQASEPATLRIAPLLLSAGMKLEKKKANLAVLVVDSMRQAPTEN
jgi:uncharacterized protein (TIGR03435 family)